jgi:hypothetical protein
VTDEEFETLLGYGHEVPGVEFKGSGSRADRAFFAKIVRAVLGMANRRDGGVVVIGVDETATGLVATGMSSADLATWTYNDVADGAALYADPGVSFDLSVRASAGKHFVVLEVAEFTELPVLCKRQYDEPGGRTILRQGALYVRSTAKPATIEIATQAEMREILNLATGKGLRALLGTVRRAGVDVEELRRETPEGRFADERLGWDD